MPDPVVPDAALEAFMDGEAGCDTVPHTKTCCIRAGLVAAYPHLMRQEVWLVAQQRDEARRALADLVRLKDGPRDEAYERDKPEAWQRARRVVDNSSEESSDVD